MQSQQLIRNHYAGGESRSARSQSFAERNAVVDLELNGRKFAADILCNRLRRLPDEIRIIFGNESRITAAHTDRETIGTPEPALEMHVQRQPERVESRTEIGARSWNSNGCQHQPIATLSPLRADS
jgi:hypothetical protein